MSLKYTTSDKSAVLSDLLIYEQSMVYCRDEITLDTHTAAFDMGTVLAKKSDGKYIKYLSDTPAGQAAHLSACAVLMQDITASETTALVFARGVVLSEDALIFDDDATDTEISTALSDLQAKGIVVRS